MQPLPYKPRVFISHSAQDILAKGFLKKLFRVLTENEQGEKGKGKFEALLDGKALQPGDPWRPVLDDWIWNCDAAIILLSEEATTSKYVYYEAMLLRQRWKAHRKSFILLPVLFPGVNESVLQERMKPLQLEEIQGISLNEKNADQVRDTLLQYLNPLCERRCARHKIEEFMFDLLCHPSLGDEHLKKISDLLAIGTFPAGATEDRARVITRALFELDAQLGDSRFRKLEDVIDKLRFMLDPPEVLKAINALVPFCWVNPEAAIKLPAIASKKTGTRIVGWGRGWDLSERMYLFRAYCNPKVHTIYISNLDGGMSTGESNETDSFLQHVYNCLWEGLCGGARFQDFGDDYPGKKSFLHNRVAQFEAKGEPVFLIIPMSAVDSGVIEALLKEWPDVTLFIHQKGLTASDFKTLGDHNHEFLFPPLESGTEYLARAEYLELIKNVGKSLNNFTDPNEYRV